MIQAPPLLSAPNIIALSVVVAVLVGIGLLLRNRVRCPKDHHAMNLVTPGKGRHMVFRCPKCGFERKSRARVGRR